MKFFLYLFCLVVAILTYVSASAIPDYDGPTYDLESSEEPKMDSGNDMMEAPRVRRFTCDFFSFSSQWVTPNHAACATKCMFKGRRGGTCHGGRCVCRR